jgi:origin recognition complex subunit 2
MSKRKHADSEDALPDTPSKRSRKAAQSEGNSTPARTETATPRKGRITLSRSRSDGRLLIQNEDRDRSGSPTPKANGTAPFSTPRRRNKSATITPSKTKNADQSAKKKSARRLAEAANEDDWDGENALAAAILGDDEEEDAAEEGQDTVEVDPSTPTTTPSKRGRGRPKGAKNKRSPTPEGDIAPEERYFFQNRAGPPQYSSNKFSTVKLLTHDEHFEQMRRSTDDHQPEKAYLMKLHARSFPQWRFESSEGYGICLYGFGSKRQLVNKYAEWLYGRSKPPPRIVIVNGYTPKLGIRHILATIASAVAGEDEKLKLTGPPQEMLEVLLSYLTKHPAPSQLVIMVNSIDAASLRKGTVQSILAGLSAHPFVSLIATADTPNFMLMWNSALLDQFNFAFHDCTTFAPYEAEISVVDEVYDLLGRKGRRMGGKDGIGFVLKSLPPNARNLYRILLSETLSILSDDLDVSIEDAVQGGEPRHSKPGNEAAEDVGIEYRLLYQKASEEFICSSDMNFRFLLKEFHDHQMITSRRDASGPELLCVPLGKEEMQAVLEDLAVA